MNIKRGIINRRNWLKISGIGSLIMVFPFLANGRQKANLGRILNTGEVGFQIPAKKSSPVSLVKGDDRYSIVMASLKNIEKEVLKSIGNKQILIKPNFVLANNPSCATDPMAVKAILDFLKPHYNKQILIGESTAATNATTLDIFEDYGYISLLKDYNVKFVDLNTDEYEFRHILGENNKPNFIRINKTFLNPNVFIISAAKMKTHAQCVVTLSLKNILMAAPVNDYKHNTWMGGDKYGMHIIPGADAHGPIFYNMFQMAHYVYPDLAVIDGFVGMEGNGPAGGTDIDSRMAISSMDALAADTVGATVMGFDPNIIPYFQFLKQGGFGQGNFDDIKIVGTPIEECKMKFKPSDESARIFNLS